MAYDVCALRASEYSRLGSVTDCCYLDHAGSALYPESLVHEHAHSLVQSVIHNPHSVHSEHIDNARIATLKLLNADPNMYYIVFTASATDALKRLAYAFKWTQYQSQFAYLHASHNSVVGIREVAKAHHAAFTVWRFNRSEENKDWRQALTCSFQSSEHLFTPAKEHAQTFNLFAFPAECNFSGVQFPLDLIQLAQNGRFQVGTPSDNVSWKVVVDAAKYCSSRRFDLSRFSPDFLVLSFYKLFGFPTGVGALIIRKEALESLNLDKGYFGGGSVDASFSQGDFFQPRSNPVEFLEAGTLPFLEIAAVERGIYYLMNRLGLRQIHQHGSTLREYLVSHMKMLCHDSGLSLCEIYDSESLYPKFSEFEQGPVVAFNLKREDGSYIGYSEVHSLAQSWNIHVRVGCFCNPGMCHEVLGICLEDLKYQLAKGHVCWDTKDLIDGKPTGCVRASLGFSSSKLECDRLVSFLRQVFLTPVPAVLPLNNPEFDRLYLKHISVFPVKSCGAFSPNSWSVDHNSGQLALDRQFALIDFQGNVLSQKRYPKMCQILPSISENLELVQFSFEDESICLRVKDFDDYDLTQTVQICQGKKCQKTKGLYQDHPVCQWFSKVLETECRLVYSSLSSFANDGSFLVVNSASFENLCKESDNLRESDYSELILNFRANFLVAGGNSDCAYAEFQWKQIQIGETVELISEGGCIRCPIININQKTGVKSPSLFQALSKSKSRADWKQQRMQFGVLMSLGEECKYSGKYLKVNVGDAIIVTRLNDKGDSDGK